TRSGSTTIPRRWIERGNRPDGCRLGRSRSRSHAGCLLPCSRHHCSHARVPRTISRSPVMQPINLPVEEYTTPDPITAEEDMTFDDLRRLMAEHGIRHLPVVRGSAVVGVISDRDVRLVSGLTVEEKAQVRAADI